MTPASPPPAPAATAPLLGLGRAELEAWALAQGQPAQEQIALLAAISAPTSLAVETAERFGVSLIGFLREESFSVYTHGHRIV